MNRINSDVAKWRRIADDARTIRARYRKAHLRIAGLPRCLQPVARWLAARMTRLLSKVETIASEGARDALHDE